MNASTCAGCGDVHLCPGSRRAADPGDENLVEQIRRYAADTFTLDPHGVVGTQEAWDAYRHWCTATGTVPYSQRRFIQAIELVPGVRRVKRSTMRLVGISWKRSQAAGRHSAPEPALSR